VLRRKKCRTDLIVMAQDYKAKAAAIEVDSKSALSITVVQNILLKTNGNRGRLASNVSSPTILSNALRSETISATNRSSEMAPLLRRTTSSSTVAPCSLTVTYLRQSLLERPHAACRIYKRAGFKLVARKSMMSSERHWSGKRGSSIRGNNRGSELPAGIQRSGAGLR